MTASSVELFACRVQAMGLPHTTSSATTASTASLQTAPRRPPLERIRGVSRNLFGSPQPGEVNSLFQKETKRCQSYVMQRYNIDIDALRSQDIPTNVSSVVVDSVPSQRPTHSLPTLIDNEMKEHKKRLQEEECNLKRANCEKVKSNVKCINETANSISGACKTVQTSISSSERPKPYARQQLLTESFNLRKNKSYSPSIMSLSASQQSTAVTSPLLTSSLMSPFSDDTTKSFNLLENTHFKSEVLHMPQAAQDNSLEGKPNETTSRAKGSTEENISTEQNKPNASSHFKSQRQRATDTTLSLKLVVTTTSSTPQDHKHQA